MAVYDGDVVKVAAEFNVPDGAIGQNVFYWRANLAADGTDAALLTAVEAFLEDFYTDILGLLVDDVSFRQSTVSKMVFTGTPGQWETAAIYGYVTPDVTPTNTDDPAPNVVAASLVAYTGRPKTRGRKQIGGVAETAFTDNDMSATAISYMAAAAVDYLSDYVVAAAGEIIPCVIRAAAGETKDLLSCVVNSIAGTMRTRKPGVGT